MTQIIKQDYVFQNKQPLPVGDIKVTILAGDAWIFTQDDDRVLHAGEQLQLSTVDPIAQIRSAYLTGFARFRIEQVC